MANVESSYAKEVERLRDMSKEGAKRVKVSLTADNTFTLAKGLTGWVMGYREIDGVKQLKVFTGTRYWYIPENQCEYIEKKEG